LNRSFLIRVSLLSAAVFLLLANMNGQQKPATPANTDGQSAAQKYFTDVLLTDQDGTKLRLYSDLLKGKVVIINPFFATCTGSCLPMNRTLAKVQEALGDRVGKDVVMISITVDPTMDTPARLKAYATQLKAKPGWHFLTGDKETVDFAQKKLGQYVEVRENHSNIVIIGNERTGLWKKAYGLARPEELVKIVDEVIKG